MLVRLVSISNHYYSCPTDSNLFEAFIPMSITSVDRLRAAFRGLHFETENRVNITCNVNLCIEFCQLVSY